MPYTMLYRAVAEEYVVPDPKRRDYTHLRVAYIIMLLKSSPTPNQSPIAVVKLKP
jgi:hypothetical protein